MPAETEDLVEAVDITLPEPFEVNGAPVTEITYTRCPTGVDLGRYTFQDLIEGQTRALQLVVPRVCEPRIPPILIKNASVRQLRALTEGFGAFFEGVELESAKPRTSGSTQTIQTGATQTPSTKSGSGASSPDRKAD